MPITQYGTLNTAALTIPDLYVQIVPPQNLVLNGVPSNRVGVVGTAIWGPVNQPVILGDYPSFVAMFGQLQPRKYDMGTHVYIAAQQGAQDFRAVRITDGTDLAATGVVVTSALTLTSLYSGTYGNTITATVSTGSKAASWKIVLSVPGKVPEVFDNLVGSGNAFWVAAAAAINAGTGPLRGRSQLVVATAGAATTAPSALAVTLSGGSDGAATITAATLVGADTVPRAGMYALRGQGCSVLDLADADDSTQWTVIDSFAIGDGEYAIQVCPAGTTIAAAVTAKQSAGLDSAWSKMMHGDWVYWNDPVNAQVRLVSPQPFVAGRLANLSPQHSSLNKPLYAVIGTQKSGAPGTAASMTYSGAELTALLSAGIDVLANPQPAGSFWGVRGGHNSSSNVAVHGDNYTRMTDFIAATLAAGMGRYVGEVINVTLFRRVRSTLLGFLQTLLQQNILGTLDGSLPFSVVCDLSNNPFGRTSIGYLQADVQVQYQAINEFFIVNLEGGQTVTVNRQTLPTTVVSV